MSNIDVVIPTSKNIESSHFSLCYAIRSILSQSYQPKQIIVVENVPDTGISPVLQSQFGGLVRIINGLDKSTNISYARNLGVSNGQSDIIVFMDDDVIIGRNDYFARITELMKFNDFCCGARRLWTTTEWHKYLSLDFPMNRNLQILKAKSFLPQSIERTTGNRNCSEFSYIGNFGAIKRDVFNLIGGFDEQYEGWLYQDTDLMMRLCVKNLAYEIMSYTDMFCYHLGHPADKQSFRKINKEKYTKKQAELKIKFSNNNFFGRFDDDTVSVITPLSETSKKLGNGKNSPHTGFGCMKKSKNQVNRQNDRSKSHTKVWALLPLLHLLWQSVCPTVRQNRSNHFPCVI